MQVHVFDNATQVMQAAATLIAAQVLRKPDSILGLATGGTPIPVYQEIIRLYKAGVVDFSRVTTFNLDEYCGIPDKHPCSYHSYMAEQLFNHINVPKEHIHLPDGNAQDMSGEGARYDAAISAAGGLDLQLLGIGHNGHIAFNEPSDQFVFGTHVVDLTPSTIEANRRFFESEAEVPSQAITMGIGTIMSAGSVVLIATGADKAEAIRKTMDDEVNPQVPASILRAHPNVVFLLDRAAAATR